MCKIQPYIAYVARVQFQRVTDKQIIDLVDTMCKIHVFGLQTCRLKAHCLHVCEAKAYRVQVCRL